MKDKSIFIQYQYHLYFINFENLLYRYILYYNQFLYLQGYIKFQSLIIPLRICSISIAQKQRLKEPHLMNRRNFLKVVGATAAVVAIQPSSISQTLYANNGDLYKRYEKVQLVDKAGQPIVASSLKKETSYFFMYPYSGTPAILVDLGEPTEKEVKLTSEDGTEYIFSGGVGKNNSIVAVSAICPHQLTHPKPSDSFFNYVPKNGKTMAYKSGGVFVCSSHLSAYDPKQGAKRVSGPAPQGLANIILEVDDNDHIWAVGVLGPDKFHDYFKAFKPEFKAIYGNWRKAKKLVKVHTPTMLLSEYCKEIIQY